MKILFILFFTSIITFGQNDTNNDSKLIEENLIGEWKFLKTLDQNGNEVKKVTSRNRITPKGKPVILEAIGPDIIINNDGTLKKIEKEKVSNGFWRIKSDDVIEYEMLISKNSKQGKAMITLQKLSPRRNYKEDEKGNFLVLDTYIILKLTDRKLEIKYEKNYKMIYAKEGK
ncbi:hypothetical protein [Mesonia sp. K7]|uniref:hypothetical protein n=1 Tax=Mesonia sp. K7 TaxID=2218606 RepID=UPI000DA7B338|nr:hypothetical protein [Mesonia sp. K7]PZD78307.1 hypothetical protein DNG35_06295 [Mesonia sp. K7]